MFSGYTHISRGRPRESSRSVVVLASSLRPWQKCKGSPTPDPPDLHHGKSRSHADMSPLASSFLIHIHTQTLTQTQPCCVLDFSHWQQVSENREDLCAGTPPPHPPASSPLLLDTFIVEKTGLPVQTSLALLHPLSHKLKISLKNASPLFLLDYLWVPSAV